VTGRAVASNQAVVMLVPRVAGLTVDAVEPRTLTVTGTRLLRPDREGETLIGPARVHRSAYRAATDVQVTVPLPDTLPSDAVSGLLSGPLAPFPSLPRQLDLSVTIGDDGPHVVSLAETPTTVPIAARLLQTALRDTTSAGAQFRGSRVARTADDRLLIVPGGPAGAAVIAEGSAAEALRLSGPAARAIQHGRLSGRLVPFPVLTAPRPRLGITIGGNTADVVLPRRPVTVADAATLLQAALRAGIGGGFTAALVAAIDEQLVLVPGNDAAVEVAAEATGDTATAAQLQLRARYPVRVRVDGAESIDPAAVELP
jgi:hypothetical protein